MVPASLGLSATTYTTPVAAIAPEPLPEPKLLPGRLDADLAHRNRGACVSERLAGAEKRRRGQAILIYLS